jgi:hypothetical protein
MYVIISAGNLVSLCEKPRYIKKNDTGIYVEAQPEDAIGIAVAGTLYNLEGGNAIPDAPEAIVREGDASEYIFRNKAQIAQNAESASVAIIGVEDAMCDMDAANDERLTAVEDALCELDEAINDQGGDNDE